MKTSIIIPTLNEARYLSETLAQIQQLSPHEIIISDGGSNDNTLKIASKFTQNLIGIKDTNANVGLILNELIELSGGNMPPPPPIPADGPQIDTGGF